MRARLRAGPRHDAAVPPSTRAEILAGAKAVAPMLVGVIPFGLVAGATPATNGLGGGAAIGFSTLVFAGASQLTAIDTLADGGGALVAVLAACTVNLRLLLYSASLAPHLAAVPLRRRLFMGYVLTDQAYAVSIARWTKEDDDAAAGGPPIPALERRVAFYMGAAVLLWVNWQICTVLGILIGAAVPDSLPLDFTVPLVFLVLLVPTITTRPAAGRRAGGRAGRPVRGRGRARPHRGAVRRARRDRGGSVGRGQAGTSRPRRHPAASRARVESMSRVWVTILLAGIGTFAMRASFLVFADRLADVPPRVQRLLRQIPPAALASIVVPALLRPQQEIDLFQSRFLAGVVAALVAWRTRNIALTLVVGVGLVMLIDAL